MLPDLYAESLARIIAGKERGQIHVDSFDRLSLVKE